jgi:hypothetical protein
MGFRPSNENGWYVCYSCIIFEIYNQMAEEVWGTDGECLKQEISHA